MVSLTWTVYQTWILNSTSFFTPPKQMFSGVYWNQPVCPSVRVAVQVSICVQNNSRVLCGSVVKCLTHNPGVLGSSRTGSFGFFRGSVLGKTLQSPSLVLVKPRKDMNNVSGRRRMTEILLKAA